MWDDSRKLRLTTAGLSPGPPCPRLAPTRGECMTRWVVASLLGGLLGCESEPAEPAGDAAADAVVEADAQGMDARVQDARADVDATPDATPDAAPDAGVDAGQDARVDAASDAVVDALVDAAPPQNPLIFNEIDCTGERWFELLNQGPGIEIADWQVSFGEGATERRWTIPLGYYIGPGAFLGFPGAREAALGTTFDLACGETVRLWHPDGTLADEATPAAVRPNGTWGRLPDGGPWQPTAYTRGASNRAPDAPDTVLFDAAHIPIIDIVLTVEDRARLDAAPREPVPAAIALTLPDEAVSEAPIAGSVALGGAPGAFRSLSGKASLVMDFPAPGLFGVTRIELDARVSDRAMLSRWLALEVYRRAGAPAPRSGLAWVRIDLGEGPRDFGLYSTLEAYDAAAAQRALGPTTQLFAVGGGQDFVRGLENQARALLGNPNDFEVLQRLIGVVERVNPAALYMLTADRIDWPGAVRLFAAEAVGDLRDGYTGERYDWGLHFDPAGKARLLGGRSERAFVAPGSLHQGSGLLFTACLADAGCRAEYDRTVGALLDALAADPLEARLRFLSGRMAPWVQRDMRRPYGPQAVVDGIEALARAVEARIGDARARMACRLGPDADRDGDGFLCEDDCAPDDARVNPRAVDVCGNGQDEDCTGVADDAVGCQDCIETTRGTRAYLLCMTPRTFAGGVDQCAAFGAVPVQVDALGEATWLDAAVARAGAEAWWLGLSDRFGLGTLTWQWDGLEPAVARWAMDEPALFAGGRCARADAVTGTWSAVPCDGALPMACEPPCFVNEDLDGDGAGTCGADCDDGNAAVHPEAAEVCGDRRDQDCDGVEDEGC